MPVTGAATFTVSGFRHPLAGVLLISGLVIFFDSNALLLAYPQEAASENGVRVAEAVRVNQPPRLDGTLNDPLWQSAQPVNSFRQREPHEGASPTEKTEVRILYTRNAVYFGVHCFDSEPSRIIATELRRDVSQDLDDHFEIQNPDRQVIRPLDGEALCRGAKRFDVMAIISKGRRNGTGRRDRNRH